MRDRPEHGVAGGRGLFALLPALAEDGLVELRAGWRQHALTLLGIVWGSAAVVLLLSLGSGFHANLDLGFKKTGDRYTLAFGQYTTSELGGARPGRQIVFTNDDYARVRASVPSARYVAAEFQRDGVAARTHYRTRTAVVSAATAELRWIKNHHVAAGRYFDAEDDRSGLPVAVLGANLPEVFFGEDDPIGATIALDGRPFRVVGVLAAKGAQYITNQAPHDEMIWIPLSQGQRLFDAGNAIGSILVDPWRLDELEAIDRELRAALFPRHRVLPDDKEAIAMFSVPETAAPFVNLALGMKLLLGFIGTVVLAMAGVGVANLMIAIVNRRRLELAMRRACGARRSDLVAQLLVETVIVVLAGGVLGVVLGTGIILALMQVPFPPIIPGPRLEGNVVLTAFVVLVGVGLVSGVTPARAAARIDPAAALRVS